MTQTETPEMKRGQEGLARLCFHDEAPVIGSGWRLVYFTVGSKWVRLWAVNGEGRATRLHRAVVSGICAGSLVHGCGRWEVWE